MFYLKLSLIIIIIISLMAHNYINELYTFFYLNTSPIIFGFLSLWSITDITNERSLSNVLEFIAEDETGMWVFVELNFFIFAFCVLLICFNLYVLYIESKKPKK